MKKEVKDYCVKTFAVEKDIFKNEDSINAFLGNLGFEIAKINRVRTIVPKIG